MDSNTSCLSSPIFVTDQQCEPLDTYNNLDLDALLGDNGHGEDIMIPRRPQRLSLFPAPAPQPNPLLVIPQAHPNPEIVATDAPLPPQQALTPLEDWDYDTPDEHERPAKQLKVCSKYCQTGTEENFWGYQSTQSQEEW